MYNKTHTSGGTEGNLYSFSELSCDSKGGVVLMSSSSSPPKQNETAPAKYIFFTAQNTNKYSFVADSQWWLSNRCYKPIKFYFFTVSCTDENEGSELYF